MLIDVGCENVVFGLVVCRCDGWYCVVWYGFVCIVF